MDIKVGKYIIAVSNEDKLIYPKDHISKADVVAYYDAIAPIMIPHMKNRLISMQRFPDGITGESFYQKDAGSYFPDWIATKGVKKENGEMVNYVIVNNPATLVYLASQLCLTPHLWLSKVAALDYPDRMIFDLDPSNKDFSLVLSAAHYLKDVLESHGLVPFVMTTGSKGLHVVVPLKPVKNFTQVKAFAHHIAQEMEEAYPEKFTTQVRKEKRKGRVFIDYLRNGFGATAVAPYSLRAKPGAPIAMPLQWDEVKKGLSPQQYTLKNIVRRINKVGDLWQSINRSARVLPKLMMLVCPLVFSHNPAEDPQKLICNTKSTSTVTIENTDDPYCCLKFLGNAEAFKKHMSWLSDEQWIANVAKLTECTLLCYADSFCSHETKQLLKTRLHPTMQQKLQEQLGDRGTLFINTLQNSIRAKWWREFRWAAINRGKNAIPGKCCNWYEWDTTSPETPKS